MKLKMRVSKNLYFTLGLLIFLWSCSSNKSSPQPTISYNRITLTFTPQNGGNVVGFMWEDLDGSGGNDPVLTNPSLVANKVYDVELKAFYVSNGTATDKTSEILNAGQSYQFFYTISSGLNLTLQYADFDSDSKPIGIKSKITSSNASLGNLKITLRYKPNKFASGVSTGNISNAGGDTYFETTPSFSVVIQ